jgi:ubiquinone/menaquinone biosynthesis C-methylase UbiE
MRMSTPMTSPVQQENLSRFDAIAAQWDESPMRTEMARAVADAISAAVPLGRHWHALEYGCGTGLVGLRLLPHLGQLLETDLSPGMLAVLSDKARAAGLEKIATQVLDLTRNPPPATRFDLIFSSMALHHIPDVAALLRAFFSMLAPGGWVALADLDAEDGSFHSPDVPGVAHHGFDRKTLEGWLDAAGFTAVSIRTAYTVEREREGAQRRYPVFLATGRRP